MITFAWPLAPNIFILITCKFCHCYLSISADAFAFKYLLNCFKNDSNIQRQTYIIDIPSVHVKLLLPANCIAAVYLRPACNTGSYIMSLFLFFVIERQIFNQ